METLQTDLLSIRKELRAVQLNLRKDIEYLNGWLRFINIGLAPIIVAFVAIALGLARARRRNAALSA